MLLKHREQRTAMGNTLSGQGGEPRDPTEPPTDESFEVVEDECPQEDADESAPSETENTRE